MTTTVDITYTKSSTRKMNISFGDHCNGFKRCVGAARQVQEDNPQTKLRLLGAAFIQALESAVPPGERSEAGRLANIAKTEIQTCVMFGIKALYTAEDELPSG